MSATLSVAPDGRPTVATLRAGQDVEGVFACTRKERQISRAGTPYLTLQLRDRTGTITARVFKDADLLAGRFERGDLVKVSGRVERFREELQMELRSIVRQDEQADAEAFLPVAYRDRDELEGFLEHLSREVYDPGLRALLERVFGDATLRAQFRRAPCSLPPSGPGRFAHHAYLGGLLEHTVAVGTLALELCTLHPRLDRDLLMSAALIHDLGKTREFTYAAEIALSDEGRLLGHIEIGLRMLAEYAPASLSRERRTSLEHCVLTHHGTEASAGTRFQLPEAAALFRLNALDAQIKGVLEFGTAR